MMLKTLLLLLKVILVMIFKTQVHKSPTTHFLRNAGLVGILPRFILSDFSKILAFDSGRKTSCLLQKCKTRYKIIVVSIYKQN